MTVEGEKIITRYKNCRFLIFLCYSDFVPAKAGAEHQNSLLDYFPPEGEQLI